MENNAFTGFHEAGPNVDKALNEWKAEYDKVSGKGPSSQMGDIGENLSLAVDKLPQMTEAKKKVDMHVKIASRILE